MPVLIVRWCSSAKALIASRTIAFLVRPRKCARSATRRPVSGSTRTESSDTCCSLRARRTCGFVWTIDITI